MVVMLHPFHLMLLLMLVHLLVMLLVLRHMLVRLGDGLPHSLLVSGVLDAGYLVHELLRKSAFIGVDKGQLALRAVRDV